MLQFKTTLKTTTSVLSTLTQERKSSEDAVWYWYDMTTHSKEVGQQFSVTRERIHKSRLGLRKLTSE